MARYPMLSAEQRLALLEPPRGPVEMVLDTDTYNEIDDQFAVVYALLSSNLNVRGLYAAPFHNRRSEGPADGMERSYQEILRLLDALGIGDRGLVYRGAERYLPSEEEPVDSPAAQALIAQALAPREGPLYVLAIGAITNVASALLMRPEIAERICIVWLGGHPYYWPTTAEFNLQQDIPAARVVFDSGAAVVHVPCKNVAEHLRTTLPEIETYVRGQGAIGDYLYQIFYDFAPDHYARSKVLWDISTVAYLNDPAWVPTALAPSPTPRDDRTWAPVDEDRHPVRVATDVRRDAVYGDLFRKLAAHAQG